MSDIYGFKDVPAAYGGCRVVVKNGFIVSALELLEDIQKLQAENAELKGQSQWVSGLVNGHSDWVIGEKAIAINLDSDDPYAFEIEWDGEIWCSIGGEGFTHWMPLPTPPEGE